MAVLCRTGSVVLVCLALSSAILCASQGAGAKSTYRVLYSFCSQSSCADGFEPASGLIADHEGNLYGTTVAGGTSVTGYGGVVFKLTSGGTETVLYNFCSLASCADGGLPSSGLIMDGSGNLYGVTQGGGDLTCQCGVVFKVSPGGTETVLHAFTAGTDGGYPLGTLVTDAKGNLYGVTFWGGGNTGCGDSNGCGTLFEVSQSGVETVLYRFCSQANCSDGFGPETDLTMDSSGNLYGGSEGGNVHCLRKSTCGEIYRLTPGGVESVLYAFCPQSGCHDGALPVAGLLLDQSGNLWSTTLGGGGGKGCSAYKGCGTVFELKSDGTESVSVTFDGRKDGATPYTGLLEDRNGNFYGMTGAGGHTKNCTASCGVVFRLSASGAESTAYTFCSRKYCTDGSEPLIDGSLIANKKGELFGATSGGGAHNAGVVFALKP